ncbi:MAG: hypothetical protein V3T60_04495 [Candidatus Binatia bacterium]
MNTKKAYVSPRVIRVNLEPTQAVLSHCNVDAHSLKNLQPTGFCDLGKDCKQAHSGDMDANS